MKPAPFFPQLIEEKLMPAALDEAIRALLCVCFPPDVAAFTKTRHWHGSAPAYSLVCQRASQVLGHVGVVVREVVAGGTARAVAGIQNLAVHPNWRAQGLGPALMIEAMDEAKRRGIYHGLLFCVPGLEKFYKSLGWIKIPDTAVMRDEQGRQVPIPGKNISMVKALSSISFPPGLIDLKGPDW